MNPSHDSVPISEAGSKSESIVVPIPILSIPFPSRYQDLDFPVVFCRLMKILSTLGTSHPVLTSITIGLTPWGGLNGRGSSKRDLTFHDLFPLHQLSDQLLNILGGAIYQVRTFSKQTGRKIENPLSESMRLTLTQQQTEHSAR